MVRWHATAFFTCQPCLAQMRNLRHDRDAWKQQNGLSRTEAKRRYITTLIDTMHKYASPSPDSRELVAELEFVWDQVKSNVPSSSSSSPLQTLSQSGLHIPQGYPQQLGQSGRAAMDRLQSTANNIDDDDQPLRVKSPMSQSEENLEEEEAEIDRDEFVDAPDSQYQYDPNNASEEDDGGVQTDYQNILRRQQQKSPQPQTPQPLPPPPQSKPQQQQQAIPTTPTPAQKMRSIIPQPIPLPSLIPSPSPTRDPRPTPKEAAADLKWRKRIEASLMKMTAEVAALREQLEARRLFAHSAHYRLFRGIYRWVWAAVKHMAINAVVLGIVLVWMRRKKDKRLEEVIRAVAGDAVKEVKRVGGGGLWWIRVPGFGKRKERG
ncbi:hypothetical protein NX059_001374 [Plenodomus lindquistii]|nr:hypothetical protein NX059_001374 [Plenodomus lindquistii]